MSYIFKHIDWELLREQKELLDNLRDTTPMSVKQIDAIDGILNLLDEFQDIAVSEGYATEEEVFGEDVE
jgi:hypothetical protein